MFSDSSDLNELSEAELKALHKYGMLSESEEKILDKYKPSIEKSKKQSIIDKRNARNAMNIFEVKQGKNYTYFDKTTREELTPKQYEERYYKYVLKRNKTGGKKRKYHKKSRKCRTKTKRRH
jgi:hypothetical protein